MMHAVVVGLGSTLIAGAGEPAAHRRRLSRRRRRTAGRCRRRPATSTADARAPHPSRDRKTRVKATFQRPGHTGHFASVRTRGGAGSRVVLPVPAGRSRTTAARSATSGSVQVAGCRRPGRPGAVGRLRPRRRVLRGSSRCRPAGSPSPARRPAGADGQLGRGCRRRARDPPAGPRAAGCSGRRRPSRPCRRGSRGAAALGDLQLVRPPACPGRTGGARSRPKRSPRCRPCRRAG